MKTDEPFYVPPCIRQREARRISPRAFIFVFSLFSFDVACLIGTRCSAQSTSDGSGSIHGVVINSVTREPIARTLVTSPDNRFATLTNSEGQFEFRLPTVDPADEDASEGNSPAPAGFRLVLIVVTR